MINKMNPLYRLEECWIFYCLKTTTMDRLFKIASPFDGSHFKFAFEEGGREMSKLLIIEALKVYG